MTIYKNLELSLGREVWRLDLSPLHISLGRLFPTGLLCQGRKHAGTTKSVCMKLPDVGVLCEVVGDWDVNKVVNYPVNYPIQNDDPLEVLSQSAPALPKNTVGVTVRGFGTPGKCTKTFNSMIYSRISDGEHLRTIW